MVENSAVLLTEEEEAEDLEVRVNGWNPWVCCNKQSDAIHKQFLILIILASCVAPGTSGCGGDFGQVSG